jgi:aspartate kinase
MGYFEKFGVSYILKSTNANSITMVVWDNEESDDLIGLLKETYYKVTVMPAAIVCAMGTNIAMPGFLYRATKALYERGINIESLAQSLMQVNMQFVIKRESYEEAVVALNESLCNQQKPEPVEV